MYLPISRLNLPLLLMLMLISACTPATSQVEATLKDPITFYASFDEGFKADLIVCEKVIVELKSKTSVNSADHKQIQTYLRLSKKKLGYLLNFGEALMKNGITRAVNGLEE